MRPPSAHDERPTPASRQRVAITLAISGTLLVVGTTGALSAATSEVTESAYVACFARAEKGLDGSSPGTTIAQATTGKGRDISGPDPIADPLGTCRSMWEQGVLTPDTQSGTVGTATSFVPELHVCVMPDGTAAVLPGDAGVCGTLGFAEVVG